MGELEEITKDLEEQVKKGEEAKAIMDRAKQLMAQGREKEAFELYIEWKKTSFPR